MEINKIRNLIVQKALIKRKDHFMFSFLYDEKAQYSEKGSFSKHEDWDEYGDYEERSTHTDDTARRRHSRHIDHTETSYDQYYETAYDEHTDTGYFEVDWAKH